MRKSQYVVVHKDPKGWWELDCDPTPRRWVAQYARDARQSACGEDHEFLVMGSKRAVTFLKRMAAKFRFDQEVARAVNLLADSMREGERVLEREYRKSRGWDVMERPDGTRYLVRTDKEGEVIHEGDER